MVWKGDRALTPSHAYLSCVLMLKRENLYCLAKDLLGSLIIQKSFGKLPILAILARHSLDG